VSNNITTCRERIQNVKNSLHTCKTLLQCRRDDLKKLWTENVEQKAVSSLLDQIYEIKHLDQSVEQAVANNKYREAVQMLKKSDILLNGPLSNIVGLNQLRQNVADSSQLLFKQMCMYLEESLVVEPFERQVRTSAFNALHWHNRFTN
jgi:exocyst complex component 4